MYRSSSKLPQWKRYPSPAYRRAYCSPRNRVIVIIATCLVAWYHYHYLTPSLQNFTQTSSDTGSQARHLKWKAEVVSYPEDVLVEKGSSTHQIVKAQQSEQEPSLLRERDETWPASSPLQAKDKQHIIDTTNSGVSPEYAEDENSPKEKLSSSPQPGSPEYVDDDAAPRNAIKQGLRQSEAVEGHGIFETIDEKPPQLVQQAFERLVEQHLAPAPKYEGEKLIPNAQSSGPKRFPPYAEYALLDEKAEALPDIVHIPFDVSTLDVVLEGWEDEWFADANLNIEKWGKIKEPKIDFVYTCKNPEILSIDIHTDT